MPEIDRYGRLWLLCYLTFHHLVYPKALTFQFLKILIDCNNDFYTLVYWFDNMSLKCATKCAMYETCCTSLIVHSIHFRNQVDRMLKVETWILFYVCRRVFAQWLSLILQFAFQIIFSFLVSCLFLVSMSVLRAPNVIRCMYSTRILDGWRINEKLAEKVLLWAVCDGRLPCAYVISRRRRE